MANLSITAASVISGDNAILESGTAGETITAGQLVYKDETSKKYMLADSNSATAAVRTPRGVALNGASNGQPLVIQRAGDITYGATLTAGTAYYLSDTPGATCPLADVGSGEYVALIGLAKSTTVLTIAIQAPGVAL
jgi:hypothetical protein